MNRGLKGYERAIGILTPLGLLLLWEAAGRLGLIDVRFFPPPSSIVHQIGVLIASGELLDNTLASLRRLALGMLLGGVPALLLGLAMGISRPLRVAIDPLISATYPIPKSAILPLVLLIFGLGELSKVVMVALGAFYPIVINTMVGVVNLDRIYLDVGHNFRASRWQVFRTIALPGALPSIMAGIKLAAGMGLILIAISEMVASNDGIGFMIWNAWQVLTVDTMYVGLLVIAILGFVFSIVLDEIERRLIPWKTNA
ncbi:ABC transporter permease [Rhodopseudomonas palustris]|uniref:Binding-protein-dependent transport systems inner membrane component n=1 Tax=Rhodopseudomonas palustris (strain BisB18) TaxID=316056 RepID=Q21B20_RHOPB